MSALAIDAEANIRFVMDRFPETVCVFLRRRMHCPGCAMAPFMSLAEAAASYGLDPRELVAELRAAAQPGIGEARP
jgi:hybrid cluster-associated redox disulfide protein